jgi:hypothetical protein
VAAAVCLRYRAGVKRLFALVLGLAAAAVAHASAARVVYAGPAWAALDLGATCDARARSELIAPKGKVQANAGFAFTPDRRLWGQFHAQLSRLPRPGSTVMLTVGGQSFLLVSRGGWAWSSGPAEEQAIIDLARVGDRIRIRFRDQSGRRFTDSYLLAGAPTAIDAAAAACAGKSVPL